MGRGPPDDSQQLGFSDDGEPAGTAGKPMLAQLMGSGVGEITAVVVRYYGGILLGTGGLVKAYGGGASGAGAADDAAQDAVNGIYFAGVSMGNWPASKRCSPTRKRR